jgi:hypothetical protein
MTNWMKNRNAFAKSCSKPLRKNVARTLVFADPPDLNEIASIADVSEADVVSVIEKFREPGRSLLTPSHGIELDSKSMIDISHESLMRIWVRLKNWVDDESEAVQMYLRLAEAASNIRLAKPVYGGRPIYNLALNWQAKHKPTLVWGQRYHPAFERTLIFLEYSKKEFDTEQRIKELEQKRKLTTRANHCVVFGTLSGIALIAFVYAFVQQAEAKRQAELAIANEAKAKENEAEAIKQQKIAVDQKDLADRARLEAEDARKAEEAQKKEAELRRAQAEVATAEAKKQRAEAERNAIAARKAEGEAKTNEERAVENAARAERERYLATASRMAIKSKELSNDPVQEALVAQQAYLFNKKFDGYPYNSDIYSGLYYALKNNDDPLTKSLEAHKNGAARTLETQV